MLVCDECNFFCCHTYCDKPKLENVPEDDWICIFCREAEISEAENEILNNNNFDHRVTRSTTRNILIETLTNNNNIRGRNVNQLRNFVEKNRSRFN